MGSKTIRYGDLARPKLVPYGSPLWNRLSEDPEWVAQEKIDGMRVLVTTSPATVTSRHGHDMRGRVGMYASEWLGGESRRGVRLVIDAELRKGRLYCFDLLSTTQAPLSERLMRLGDALEGANQGVFMCPTVREGKREFYADVVYGGGEGVVLKSLRDPYPRLCGAVWFKVKS